MIKGKLNDSLLQELRQRIGNGSELVNRLSDILCLGKEAIYRRLRGDVPFSLEEASILAYHTGLSLDGLSGIAELKRPFLFRIANFAYPQDIDYKMINEFVEFLEYIRDMPDTEMGVAAKLIPDGLHLDFAHITRFYLFKWIYQYDNKFPVRKYEDVAGTDKLLHILKNMKNMLSHIKKAYYIFDKKIIEYFVDDVNYFKMIGLISETDVQLIKQDLYNCLTYIESLAMKGVNDVGNKIEIYLSNLNFEAGFSYIESEHYQLSSIRAFTMYDISSADKISFEYSMKWMQSLKRASSLISQTAEIERMNFFKKQRAIVDTL